MLLFRLFKSVHNNIISIYVCIINCAQYSVLDGGRDEGEDQQQRERKGGDGRAINARKSVFASSPQKDTNKRRIRRGANTKIDGESPAGRIMNWNSVAVVDVVVALLIRDFIKLQARLEHHHRTKLNCLLLPFIREGRHHLLLQHHSRRLVIQPGIIHLHIKSTSQPPPTSRSL